MAKVVPPKKTEAELIAEKAYNEEFDAAYRVFRDQIKIPYQEFTDRIARALKVYQEAIKK
jgi:hypothetical protein